MIAVNVIVLSGELVTDPVMVRRTPTAGGAGGGEVLELRVQAPAPGEGRRHLPLPVILVRDRIGEPAWAAALELQQGCAVLVHGSLVRRFYRSGAGARSLTEVVAVEVRALEARPELEAVGTDG